MDDFQVRAATPRDLDAIVAGNQGLARETEEVALEPDRLRAGVGALLRDERKGRYWVAETPGPGGAVVGQLMITLEWSDWRDATFWWIQSVYVHRDHRRRGVYRRLYDHVLQRAREDPGVCGIRLYVDRSNRPARDTYLALGMTASRYDLFEVDFVLEREA